MTRVLAPHNVNIPRTPISKLEPSDGKTQLREEQRRALLYESLVRAQRQYAEKLSQPNGAAGRFTTEEWNSLGDNFEIEDWEGGFVSETHLHRALKKENMGNTC